MSQKRYTLCQKNTSILRLYKIEIEIVMILLSNIILFDKIVHLRLNFELMLINLIVIILCTGK